jgi:hypothetical protein
MFDWFFEAGCPNSLEEGKLGDLGLERWEGGCEAASSAAGPPYRSPHPAAVPSRLPGAGRYSEGIPGLVQQREGAMGLEP